MTSVSFPTGDPFWDDIEDNNLAAGYSFMLLTGLYVPDATTQVFVADIVADELGDATYNRAPFLFADIGPGNGVTLDLPTGIWTFTADDPDFGSPDGGEEARWCAAFADTGNDATSTLMRAYSVRHDTDGTPYQPKVNPAGLNRRRR